MTGSLPLLARAAIAGAVDLRALRPALLVASVAALALVTLHRNRLMPCSAGVERLRDAKGRWVRTYRLTHATAHDGAPDVRLDLRDHHDPDAWANGRNGIPHPVGFGARRNHRMPEALDLAQEPRR